MDVTTTLSLGDPLEPARKATAQMLQERERTFRCRNRSTVMSACLISTCRKSSRKNG